MTLTPLFEAPSGASPPGLGADAAPRRSWFKASGTTAGDGDGLAAVHPWDVAHQLMTDGMGLAGAPRPEIVEPDLEQTWVWTPDPARGIGFAAAEPVSCEQVPPQKGPPFVPGPGFAWHLKDAYSGLGAARDAAEAAGAPVKIVHLDTGFDPQHAARPENLSLNDMRNFVDEDRPNDATDRTPPGGLRNRGHGTGTLGILAGRKLTAGILPPEAAGGYLGGAPRETVVPVRIADSVVHFWTSTVAQGIAYACEIGADVVSMSMGGLPAASWADAVNAAYEAGIVVVCAAGNNFGGLPTSLIVYPARFGRVIAACGAMADKTPYFHIPGFEMQGNVGPITKMATAVTAYTPNIPWARLGCEQTVDLDGAGTSAATPQVAAAAALWLRRNGANFPARDWRRAEAARQALFRTADHLGRNDPTPDPFFGRGLLRAGAALQEANPAGLQMMPRDSASFAFLHLLTSGLGAADDPRATLHALELTQLALVSRAAQEALPDPDQSPTAVSVAQRRRFLEAILGDRRASASLQRFLADALGRSAGGGAPSTAPAPAPAAKAAAPASGATLPRRALPPPPPNRRLRIFATDPGDARSLKTAFTNTATVEVPWETRGGDTNALQPGPVGEYVEVVDVDPASGLAYAPVDLNDPLLLAQDGHAPSEGNPQFHQQMVYAVAMRTIRNFEGALGRRALWAPHRVKLPASAPADEAKPQADTPAEQPVRYAESYVQRLRIYPHALRQANAYYSPDKAALLFGYFPAHTADAGRSLVFTCLSHDVVAHETTHALLDGLHRRFQEPTNPDVLAFHEGFADICAIFQHFTFPELLRFEIARSRGDLAQDKMFASLAREFGRTLGRSDGLRNAIGETPTGREYDEATEPHAHGAVLVAAVFDAFLGIYARRSEDLLRLATGGSGVLQPGAPPPDLVGRLADEAAKAAQHVLTICIRALDYMPPVDPTFGDYLRALITADSDLVPNDRYGYRVAFLEAFARRGIYADGVKTVSQESLRWQTPAPEAQPTGLGDFIRQRIDLSWDLRADRRESYVAAKTNAARLHGWLSGLAPDVARLLGLDFSEQSDGSKLPFEVHSVRPARRVSPDGDIRTDIIAVITQHDPPDAATDGPPFRGGCTLVLDRREGMDPIRYCVAKPLFSASRRAKVQAFQRQALGLGLRALYFGGDGASKEPFALLHMDG